MLPRIVEEIKKVITLIVKIMEEMPLLVMVVGIEQEVNTHQK
jgi:hypothetical protein